MKCLFLFVLLLSTLTLSNFAGLSASIDATANQTKHYKEFIDSIHKTILVPENYTTIQEAIKKANEGDTIDVSPGIYYENLVLNKAVNLIGKDKYTTILDGKDDGNVVEVTADNVTISGFTIKNGEVGIYLLHVGDCLIEGNIVKNNGDGIEAASSWNCRVIDNNSSNNSGLNRGRGILLGKSWNCIVEHNIVEKNEGYGLNLHLSQNCSAIGNTVRGGQTDHNTIGLLSCDRCFVINNTASYSHGFGIWVDSSTNCVIDKNNVNNNRYGIGLVNSSQCIVRQNNIRNSQVYNLGLYSSNTNTFCRNNFFKTNEKQVESVDSVNTLHNDTSKEGNYWSDYNGADNDNDGIGNTAYIVDNDERDDYPLVASFNSFLVSHDSETHVVEVISNSTISNFVFDADANEIRFKVSGANSMYGFCRIGVPKALMNGTLVVKVDGSAPITEKKLEHPNIAFNYLYFTYVHSIHQVTITLEKPQEFSLSQFLPFLLVALAALVGSALIIVTRKRKSHLRMRRENE